MCNGIQMSTARKAVGLCCPWHAEDLWANALAAKTARKSQGKAGILVHGLRSPYLLCCSIIKLPTPVTLAEIDFPWPLWISLCQHKGRHGGRHSDMEPDPGALGGNGRFWAGPAGELNLKAQDLLVLRVWPVLCAWSLGQLSLHKGAKDWGQWVLYFTASRWGKRAAHRALV